MSDDSRTFGVHSEGRFLRPFGHSVRRSLAQVAAIPRGIEMPANSAGSPSTKAVRYQPGTPRPPKSATGSRPVWRPASAFITLALTLLFGMVAVGTEAASADSELALAPSHELGSTPAESFLRHPGAGIGGQSMPFAPAFIPNEGQMDAQVQFIYQGRQGSLFFLEDRIVERIRGYGETLDRVQQFEISTSESGHWVAADPLPGKVNVFLGQDRSRWASGLERYGRLQFESSIAGETLFVEASAQGVRMAATEAGRFRLGPLKMPQGDASRRLERLESGAGPSLRWLDERGQAMHAPLAGSMLTGDRVSPSTHASELNALDADRGQHLADLGIGVGNEGHLIYLLSLLQRLRPRRHRHRASHRARSCRQGAPGTTSHFRTANR